MALDIDGFAVMRSIAAHPSTFPDVAADAAKAARGMVTKQFKAKAFTLASLRNIRKALGAETFNLIMDGLPDAQIKTLVTKFDKHHLDLKTSNPQWRRRQLSALAEGSAEPAEKPKKEPKAKAAKKASAKQPKAQPERLDYSSAGATRKR
jgi:hypothetical protein